MAEEWQKFSGDQAYRDAAVAARIGIRLRVAAMFYFPAPPPRVRTAFEPVYAPLRWLVGSVALVALFAVALGVGLVLLRPLRAAGWMASRSGIADLRRWAFEGRVTQAERDDFIREEHRRMDAAADSLGDRAP
jgi:hypothetical protein